MYHPHSHAIRSTLHAPRAEPLDPHLVPGTTVAWWHDRGRWCRGVLVGPLQPVEVGTRRTMAWPVVRTSGSWEPELEPLEASLVRVPLVWEGQPVVDNLARYAQLYDLPPFPLDPGPRLDAALAQLVHRLEQARPGEEAVVHLNVGGWPMPASPEA